MPTDPTMSEPWSDPDPGIDPGPAVDPGPDREVATPPARADEVEPRHPVASPATSPAAPPSTVGEPAMAPTGTSPQKGFLPPGPPRLAAESVLVRLIASAGVVGIGTVLGAILGAYDVAGWIVGLVVSVVSLVMAAVLWRSRRL